MRRVWLLSLVFLPAGDGGGGDDWAKYNKLVREQLIGSQNADGSSRKPQLKPKTAVKTHDSHGKTTNYPD